MNCEEIKSILKLIDETGLEYVRLNNKDIELEVSKKVNNRLNIDNNLETFKDSDAEDTINDKVEEIKNNTEDNIKSNILKNNETEIKAPLIGTYYSSPSPDEPCFVKVGDYVEKGDTLCIIEAMKLMNEIKSDKSGKIVDIKVDNETIVEYGQTLFVIEE